MDWAELVARLAQYLGVAVAGGAALFFVYGWRPGAQRWPRLMVAIGAALGAVGTAGWLVAKAGQLADRPAQALDPTFLFTVADGTSFGRAAMVRLGLLLAALIVAIVRPRAWLALSAIGLAAAASFAWTGHGASTDGSAGAVHLAADVLHLLSAVTWLGALAALLGVMLAPGCTPRQAHEALEAFSRVGVPVVLVVLLSGIANSWFLVGPDGLGGLLTTRYGLALTAKVGLFAAMLGLAASNRFQHAPRLVRAGADGDTQLEAAVSVATEAIAALAVLGLVSWLGTLPPPAHG